MGAKVKSARQVRYLLSRVSPLTSGQQANLKQELHSGEVHVAAGRPGGYGKKRR